MTKQWPGTPAEWDAERDRRTQAIIDAKGFASRELPMHYATATMPPRPVEPPYTCEQCGVTDGDVYRFLGNYGHLTAESCREALKRELRALRDGPAPRPVEPPSVVTASGYRVTHSGTTFTVHKRQSHYVNCADAHTAAYHANATEAEHDAIRALRDGPAPRYEPDEDLWRVRSSTGEHYGALPYPQAMLTTELNGGTAHAIYRRVEGDK